MAEIGELRKHLQTLTKGNDMHRRETLHVLKSYEETKWAAAPADLVHSLVDSLLHQIPREGKPATTHKDVAAILGNMGPRSKSAVSNLIEFLHDDVPDPVRESAAVALGKIGRDAKGAIDRLVDLANGRNALAVQAVRALGNIGCADQRVKGVLLELWSSPLLTQNGQVQVALALCKLKIHAPNIASVLTTYVLASQDVAQRKAAAEALGWCNKNDDNVVPVLLATSLNDKNEEVIAVCKNALERLNVTHDQAILICARQLKSSAHAATALRKSGVAAVPALIKAMGDPDADVRINSARTLATIGEAAAAAAPSLSTALRDRNPEVRLAAAKGLWNVNKNADVVVPVLIALLEEKPKKNDADSEAARQFLLTVIEALWRIGPPAISARSALNSKTKDKNRLVSESARNAIKKIDGM